MEANTPTINVPAGSVYFSQMHSLNWWNRPDSEILDKLYHEILVYGLQNESLIVTDSHALQSAWLRHLLENQEKYPGVSDLITEGVVRVARRSDAKTGDPMPLDAIYQTQRGSVNVVLDGKETLMPDDFALHAQNLEQLSQAAEKKGNTPPVYSIERIDLGGLMYQVFTDEDVYGSYGLSDQDASFLRANYKYFFNNAGLFMARSLYQFPSTDAGSFLKPVEQQIKILAASTHSANFALNYHLPPSTSPLAVDHHGAMSLFQKHLPEFDFLPEYHTEGTQEKKSSSRRAADLIDAKTTRALNPRVVLELRQSDEFRAYVQARNLLFRSFRQNDVRTVRENTEKFTAANLNYVRYILGYLSYSIPDDSTARMYMTQIEKAAKQKENSSSFLVSLWNMLMPGKLVHILACDRDAQQEAVDSATNDSRKVLSDTRRILNIL